MNAWPIPDNINPELRQKMLAVFSREEIQNLVALRDDDGSLIGIGFWNQAWEFSQYADPKKAEVIALMEEQFRKELKDSLFISWR